MTLDSTDLARHALGVLLVAGVIAMVYVAATPSQSGTAYAEFYLLNEDGVAADYPTNVTVGENATVTVGVGNRRPAAARYAVVVTLDDRRLARYALTVPPDGTRERRVTFAVDDPGEYTLRAHLYRGEAVGGEPIQHLRLFVRVRPAAGTPTPTGPGASSPTPTATG